SSHVMFLAGLLKIFFFFSSRRRHTSFSRDWSSDVCSSDLTYSDQETPASSSQPPRKRQPRYSRPRDCLPGLCTLYCTHRTKPSTRRPRNRSSGSSSIPREILPEAGT